ncbi:MAG: 6-pyruvoyl-tetrahydropterin synthase [Flavobacteriales bacterium]|jgi:6-pyruvoyl-tetrahydropterin synthase
MRLFVDQLTNLDFSYLHPNRGLVGETWIASIELEGELDEQGMIVDFGKVKKTVRNWLDETIDHKLLVPSMAKQLTYDNSSSEQHKLSWDYDKGTLSTSAPMEAHCIIAATAINMETVASYCIEALKQLFPESVQSLRLRFEIENIPGPAYHYSHGLKKHDGNCQRICHGHRSKIEIWRNNELDKNLMNDWALSWADIYLGSEEDLYNSDDDRHHFSYKAQQGEFAVSLPKNSCYLIGTDTTVELIALHITRTLKAQHPNEIIEVKAYEGLSKGAIVKL